MCYMLSNMRILHVTSTQHINIAYRVQQIITETASLLPLPAAVVALKFTKFVWGLSVKRGFVA